MDGVHPDTLNESETATARIRGDNFRQRPAKARVEEISDTSVRDVPMRLQNLRINELRNRVVHKNAYRPRRAPRAPAGGNRPGGTFVAGERSLFATEAGTPLNRHNLGSRSFKPLLRRACLSEKTRFHDLRHTCATLLLGKGVHPKIVQELLGHATIAITLDTYSHVLPGIGDAQPRDGGSALSKHV